MSDEARTIVIGIGNLDRGDDAAGRLVARQLVGFFSSNVDAVEHDGEPAGLIELWRGYDRAIVIDAVRSDAEPGTLIRADASREPMPAAFAHGSTHTFGLVEAIALARALNRLPSELIVYGIAGRKFGLGDAPTSEVLAGVDSAARRVLTEI